MFANLKLHVKMMLREGRLVHDVNVGVLNEPDSYHLASLKRSWGNSGQTFLTSLKIRVFGSTNTACNTAAPVHVYNLLTRVVVKKHQVNSIHPSIKRICRGPGSRNVVGFGIWVVCSRVVDLDAFIVAPRQFPGESLDVAMV